MLFVVGFFSISIIFAYAAEPVKQVIRRDHISGIEQFPSCAEVGLCVNEQRLVVRKSDVRTQLRLKQKGCSVQHLLAEESVFSCPKGIATRGTRKERVLRAQDIISTKQIKADMSWAQGATGTGVKVVVLDTGVEKTHADLSGRVSLMQNFTTGQPEDALGHGTHVSGILAGRGMRDFSGNSAVGVSGDANLLMGKVCNDAGWCLEGDILAGMEWAAAQGAKVVNLSLGGGSFGAHCDDDPLARKANWLADQGIVVVAAAGNNAAGVGTPACGSKVLAVGAVDAADVRASWSSYGQALDVMAPGVDILSAYSCLAAVGCPGTWYAWMSGTSMASPHVAGIAALLLGKYDQLTASQVREIIVSSSQDLGTTGYDILYGYGRVDAEAALKKAALLFPEPPVCPDSDGDGITVCDGDCNDADASLYPGAAEICNGKDDNCDALQDNECRFEGFCGDTICQSDETHLICPKDCRHTNWQRGKNKKEAEDVVCGDGQCHATENNRTCSRDCHVPASSNVGSSLLPNAVSSGPGTSSGNGNAGNSGNNGNGTGGSSGGGRGGEKK